MFQKLTDREEWIAKQIADIAINIHRQLGPGLLESIYAKCFYYELSKKEIAFEREKYVPIIYNVIEFKAQENYHPVWEAQILSYLKLTKKRLGFLINFHVPLMKDGIKRIIM
jgi:hypothetical protein